jgi:hypothetical protein
MPVRDIQSNLALIASEDITLTTGASVHSGSVIDTKDFSRGLIIGVELADPLDPTDDIRYSFQGSADGSTGWTAISADSILPTWNQANNNILEDTTSNDPAYIQTFGTSCNSYRYLKPMLEVVVLVAATLVVTLRPILKSELGPFVGWSATKLPNDGKP